MTKLSANKQSTSLKIASIIASLFFTGFLLTFSSCEKKAGQIGYIIQPEDSKLEIGYSDTTSLYGYSVRIDSIRSDKLTSTALGSINDPVFGRTTAGFYTTFNLSVNEKDFGTNPQLDSLVLQLYYSGAYGDTNTTLNVMVYQIDDVSEILDDDTSYYSNLELELKDINYSDFSFEPRPNDSIYVDGDTLPPAIRINLSNTNTYLGNYLLAAVDSTDMEDSDAFRSYFNGLYVTVDDISSGDGTFAYFNLSSSYSKMTVYYHNEDSDDTLSYDYNITSSNATVGLFNHNFETADNNFKQQVIYGDTTLGSQILYAQGFGGVKTFLKFPYLFEWAKLKNLAVNEAKLIIPAADVQGFYDAPDQLTMLMINEVGETELLVDYNEGTSYFDGYYDEDNDQYIFRITRYIQSFISDTTQVNNGLYLQVYGASVVPERFAIKGHKADPDTLSGIRLEMIYTDL